MDDPITGRRVPNASAFSSTKRLARDPRVGG